MGCSTMLRKVYTKFHYVIAMDCCVFDGTYNVVVGFGGNLYICFEAVSGHGLQILAIGFYTSSQ